VSLAKTERAALADLFDEVGPDHPTKCEGWQTRDLVAHLLLRERRPDASLGIVTPIGRSYNAKVIEGYLARPWDEVVQMYRSGAPWWSPAHLDKVDDLMNGVEFFIHHEDVRRARPEWEPRTLSDSDTAELTKVVDSFYIKRAVKKAGIGVTVALPDGRRIELRAGDPTVVVTGEPGEILIWASGRPAAKVELTGSQQGVEALEAAGLRVGG
jgi:uncharacterized protein (TIGR03085 family)